MLVLQPAWAFLYTMYIHTKNVLIILDLWNCGPAAMTHCITRQGLSKIKVTNLFYQLSRETIPLPPRPIDKEVHTYPHPSYSPPEPPS
jgi:hypothetical protein